MNCRQQGIQEVLLHKETMLEQEQVRPQPSFPLDGCGNGYDPPCQGRTAVCNFLREVIAVEKQVCALIPHQQ